jgi:hypothetical protein
VRTPTLFLASADDPFIRHHPVTACAANPATILALTQVRFRRDRFPPTGELGYRGAEGLGYRSTVKPTVFSALVN